MVSSRFVKHDLPLTKPCWWSLILRSTNSTIDDLSTLSNTLQIMHVSKRIGMFDMSHFIVDAVFLFILFETFVINREIRNIGEVCQMVST